MRKIEVRGARENNLQNVDVDIPGNQFTVITGVSGSGKSSLAFDTIYHEARRLFLDMFTLGSSVKLSPAAVDTISGLGPAVAVGQNVLNRNPLSTLATASGLHPFLRLLYSTFGERHCPQCGTEITVLTEDEVVERIVRKANANPVTVSVPLVSHVTGSHRTLLAFLTKEYGSENVVADGQCETHELDPGTPHDIHIRIALLPKDASPRDVRPIVQQGFSLGSPALLIQSQDGEEPLSRAPVCPSCGTFVGDVNPRHFHLVCSHCKGGGCEHCQGTGLHPQAAAVTWHELRLPDLLALSVDEAHTLFASVLFPESARRLETEIKRRLDALHQVGLSYVTLNRPSPTLSRGEAQRVRLAVTLTSRLEDMLHVFDEPTIGQHPYDVQRLLPAFRGLGGPVVVVEHDRMAAGAADYAVDLGPGAGHEGGKILFAGTPSQLWEADTPTGRYFSFRERVKMPERRRAPTRFLTMRGVHARNLKAIDLPIPLGRLTVITGVSGSGKSTVVEVLAASLKGKTSVGCQRIEGPLLTPVLVDQSPIGRNPRSNPATYTKLADTIRDLFARATKLSPSHFSFNRPEGACPVCKGMGALEVSIRYLPSTWIVCDSCGGDRFSDDVLAKEVSFKDHSYSIADFYRLSIDEAAPLLAGDRRLPEKERKRAHHILEALREVGLGYLPLGQPSPTLSGGEAQRVKLAKYLGMKSLSRQLLVLDEPSTGLHPQDISGLLTVLDRLVRAGGTVVVVEHNTDIIRAADWIVDLGPGAGPEGGELICAGTPEELLREERSFTGRALKSEAEIQPHHPERSVEPSRSISIEKASAHNLKQVSVEIPKAALTVVTGVSGSGKSSLLIDVLEAEARRRFLESLSLYERQSTKEGPEAPVESVSGLGAAVSVGTGRRQFSRRATVGTDTEILHHIAVLLTYMGQRTCLACGRNMVRGEEWVCPHCGTRAPIARPAEFFYSNWHSICPKCQGIGTIQVPRPEKLIIHPEKPVCGGAMYSPGFFPKGYLCKPFNYGYSIVRALSEKYHFDPDTTPWKDMTPEAQHAFLFGDPEPLRVTHVSRDGRTTTALRRCPGFYGWVRDWDIGGTYTEAVTCPECRGGRLRPEFLAVTLNGFSVHALSEMPLSQLYEVFSTLPPSESRLTKPSFQTVMRRLRFLLQVGLGYVHLNRITASLSAGEAERVNLAGILGSRLTSLTVLLDEPSRGLHPSEVGSLVETLKELRDEGNTVIVVEHDPVVIRAADHLVDMGPGAGVRGGYVVAEGTPEEVANADTVTGAWLRGKKMRVRTRIAPKKWMVVRGARENNLKGEDVRIPLGVLVGICGVSGSGKSTLLIDTVGRVLAPTKHTTSVAQEPLKPGAHDALEGAPPRAVLVDQTRKGILSPSTFLGLTQLLQRVFSESEDARALGVGVKQLSRSCSACDGSGTLKMDMGFLPAVYTPCDTCGGTGYPPEVWDIRVRGMALPEVEGLTIDEVYAIFRDHAAIARLLKAARDAGLGYLVLRQPGYTLSGGEAQRLKIAGELCGKVPEHSLYILDEPTVGQHLEDVNRLITVLQRLVDAGHSVVVIEHSPYVLAACDWLIELGPGGGPEGGHIVACGTPEEIAAGNTPTAMYVREVLEVEP